MPLSDAQRAALLEKLDEVLVALKVVEAATQELRAVVRSSDPSPPGDDVRLEAKSHLWDERCKLTELILEINFTINGSVDREAMLRRDHPRLFQKEASSPSLTDLIGEL